jgi:hypothetical protein
MSPRFIKPEHFALSAPAFQEELMDESALPAKARAWSVQEKILVTDSNLDFPGSAAVSAAVARVSRATQGSIRRDA